VRSLRSVYRMEAVRATALVRVGVLSHFPDPALHHPTHQCVLATQLMWFWALTSLGFCHGLDITNKRNSQFHRCCFIVKGCEPYKHYFTYFHYFGDFVAVEYISESTVELIFDINVPEYDYTNCPISDLFVCLCLLDVVSGPNDSNIDNANKQRTLKSC
jgi:hypothetical protein